MYQLFARLSCQNYFFDRCNDASFESASYWANTRTADDSTCEPCDTINGTILKLDTLVMQVPFLTTADIAGLEDVRGWERERYEDLLFKKKRVSHRWENDVESRAERQEVAEKLKSLGLDGIGDGKEEHRGFETVMTSDQNGDWSVKKYQKPSQQVSGKSKENEKLEPEEDRTSSG